MRKQITSFCNNTTLYNEQGIFTLYHQDNWLGRRGMCHVRLACDAVPRENSTTGQHVEVQSNRMQVLIHRCGHSVNDCEACVTWSRVVSGILVLFEWNELICETVITGQCPCECSKTAMKVSVWFVLSWTDSCNCLKWSDKLYFEFVLTFQLSIFGEGTNKKQHTQTEDKREFDKPACWTGHFLIFVASILVIWMCCLKSKLCDWTKKDSVWKKCLGAGYII